VAAGRFPDTTGGAVGGGAAAVVGVVGGRGGAVVGVVTGGRWVVVVVGGRWVVVVVGGRVVVVAGVVVVVTGARDVVVAGVVVVVWRGRGREREATARVWPPVATEVGVSDAPQAARTSTAARPRPTNRRCALVVMTWASTGETVI
jgi:hypothetical protein